MFGLCFKHPFTLYEISLIFLLWNSPIIWGRIGFDVDEEAKVAGRGAAGLVKSGNNVIANNNDYAYSYAA